MSSTAATAPRPLDLHGAIRDAPAEASATGCARWPRALRLASSRGQLVRGRCRATNLCRYCQRHYVMETVEMLSLDAMEHAPTLWAVLTAREHLTREACTDHLRQLRRSVRRRWAGAEWFVQVEFQRRGALHLNLLVKGVPVEDEDELRELLAAVWCSRVDALPVGQWVGAVADAEGVVRYLSKMLAHGLKAEQAPPLGWRGHRTSQTRGYLVRPASVMRAEAKRSLRFKRELWRAEGEGLEPAEAWHVAEARQLRDEGVRWECVILTVHPETGELEGARRLDGREVTVRQPDRTRQLARELQRRAEEAEYCRAATSSRSEPSPVAPLALHGGSYRRRV